jgi:hypothetical protein
MNYSALFQNLKKEVNSACQYKHLDSPFKAFGVVATIPFWIVYFGLICLKGIYLFCYYCFASSSDYLESWLKDNKKEIHPATEAVLYFVTIPTIFFLRCMLSMFSVAFFILWFNFMCVGYIVTLGGIRWQPFISSAQFDGITIEPITNKTAGAAVVLIGFVSLCLTFLLYLVGFAADEYDMIEIATYFVLIYTSFMVIAVPLTFKNKAVEINAKKESESISDSRESSDEFEEEFPEF